MINPRFKNVFRFNHGSICGAWNNAVSFNSTSEGRITVQNLFFHAKAEDTVCVREVSRAGRTLTTTNEKNEMRVIVLAIKSFCCVEKHTGMEAKIGDLVYVTQSRENALCLSRYFQGVHFCVFCKAEDNKIPLKLHVTTTTQTRHWDTLVWVVYILVIIWISIWAFV